VNADPETPLLWVLRDIIGLTGTRYGCRIEICGACTVMIDGQAEKACDKALKEPQSRLAAPGLWAHRQQPHNPAPV